MLSGLWCSRQRGDRRSPLQENPRLPSWCAPALSPVLPERPVNAAHHSLERRADDVAVDADAEQRLLAVDAHLHIGRGTGIGPAADGVLAVIHDLDVLAAEFAQGIDEGVDRAVAFAFDCALLAVVGDLRRHEARALGAAVGQGLVAEEAEAAVARQVLALEAAPDVAGLQFLARLIGAALDHLAEL